VLKESQGNPLYPTASKNTVPSGHNQSATYHPTPVEDDDHNESQSHDQFQTDYKKTQVDDFIFKGITSNDSEQLHEYIRQLHMELADHKSKIGTLTQQNHQLYQSMQQMQGELNIEKEKLFEAQQQVRHHKQINECYAIQVDKISAQTQCPLAERYLMNKRPHGIAVIINNLEFESTGYADEECNRKGSDVDEKNLCVTWEYLQYDVRIFRNLKASQITHELMQIALQNHKNYDSFVCFILSHGDMDVVVGVDNQAVKISDLANLFKANSCPSLRNKPKLFFIQACRGEYKDRGVRDQKDGGIYSSLPSDSDFMFSYATPPGNVSWRTPRYGSWYIQSLCDVFVENAPQQDLVTMLLMVNSKVSEIYTNEGYKQCPAPVIMLRKQVWFFGNSA